MSDTPLQKRIIEEATRCFAQGGYAKTSVREIAEAVGTTKPSIYYHFGSKAGLFKATIECHLGCWGQSAQTLVDARELPAVERIRAWLEMGIGLASESPDLMKLVIRAHLDATEGAPSIDFDAYRHRDQATLAALVQDGIDSGALRPHDVDDSICALMGMIHFRIMDILAGGTAREDAADRILATYLNGVGA